MPTLSHLLSKKKLNPALFKNKHEMSSAMPINLHVGWVFEHIYINPYPIAKLSTQFFRIIHGIQHVTRTAIYIPIFVNLYRRYGNEDALALNEEDIKLLQIAALFHDSGRENEGVDLWDQDSALFFYEYATNIIHIPPAKAKLLAEAIANKDAEADTYFELIPQPESVYIWEKRAYKSPKNIYQKIIHDADCLDIIRARDHFEAGYLDFYKDIALSNKDAFKIMAKLITEARSLIASQGDSRLRLNPYIKSAYEHPDAYDDMIHFIAEYVDRYPIIISLGANKPLIGEALHQQLLPSFLEDDSAVVTKEVRLLKAMHSGKLLVRAVGSPAAVYKHRKKDEEHAAKTECRKMTRRSGKLGNPNRSVSMLFFGVVTYASQGFLIENPEIDDIGIISSENIASGRGKKNHVVASELSREEKSAKLEALHHTLQMGGSSKRYGGLPYTHNEILYRVTKADAIYYTADPTRHNNLMYGDDSPCNSYTHYLQALFLQIEYQKATGITLPIYEYSGIHNFLKEIPDLTDEDIVAIWVAIISPVIETLLESDDSYWSKNVETLKIFAIDGYLGENSYIKKQNALDINYSSALKEKINAALEQIKIEHEIQFYEATQSVDNLSFFLNSSSAEYREKIWMHVQGKLNTLIQNGAQLINLLKLPLELLNALQREQIITAIEPRLGTLIKDGLHLYFLLTLDTLTSEQRERIWIAVQDKVGSLIKGGMQLFRLLSLSESVLKAKHKEKMIHILESESKLSIEDVTYKPLKTLIRNYLGSKSISPVPMYERPLALDKYPALTSHCALSIYSSPLAIRPTQTGSSPQASAVASAEIVSPFCGSGTKVSAFKGRTASELESRAEGTIFFAPKHQQGFQPLSDEAISPQIK